MKNVWCYDPKKCYGDYFPQDCDNCDKASIDDEKEVKNMEEQMVVDTKWIKALCYHIIELADFCELMMRTPSCNDCARVNNCEHAPDWGEQVRYNCHLYEGKEK